MRVCFAYLFATVFLTGSSFAAIRFELLNMEKREVRIIYELEDTLAGNKVFLFPEEGMHHDSTVGDFVVESIFDIDTKREQAYEVELVEKTKLPRVKITYDEPIKENEKKVLQISFRLNLPKEMLIVDNQGRVTLDYETSHAFEFLTPIGYYLVFTNQPVWLFEKGNQVIVQQLDKKSRKITLQLRPMKNQF